MLTQQMQAESVHQQACEVFTRQRQAESENVHVPTCGSTQQDFDTPQRLGYATYTQGKGGSVAALATGGTGAGGFRAGGRGGNVAASSVAPAPFGPAAKGGKGCSVAAAAKSGAAKGGHGVAHYAQFVYHAKGKQGKAQSSLAAKQESSDKDKQKDIELLAQDTSDLFDPRQLGQRDEFDHQPNMPVRRKRPTRPACPERGA